MAKYYCKHCGKAFNSVTSLRIGYCFRHPAGANRGPHELYEGSEKSQYTCKYCGRKFSSIAAMTRQYCFRHPKGANKGNHSPALN